MTKAIFTCGICGKVGTTEIRKQKKAELCTPCLAAEYLRLHDTFKGPGTFGIVVWSDDDIREKLKEHELPVTEENVEKVRDSYAARHIDDTMTEAGWEVLDSAVLDLKSGVYENENTV